MALNPIAFTARVNKNIDEIASSQSAIEMTDCFIDEAGFANRRAGLEIFSSITGAGKIDGIYYWDERLVRIVVSSGVVYSLTSFGVPTVIGSGLLASGTVTFTPASIAGVQVLAMANGNGVFTTDGTTLTAQAASPNDATHVAFIDRYLLANDSNTGLLKWSDLNDPTVWNALNFAEAERKPDNLAAVHVQGRDVVLFGFRSIEFYYNDGSSPFIRFEGGEVETGVSVVHSIQFIPEIGSWLYIDENRHLIRLTNRQPTKISGPYDAEIQALGVISDGVSSVSRVGGRGFYIISFPTENKTFVYDYQQDAWYRWGNWDSSTASYDMFIGNVMTYDTRTNNFLVGGSDGGLIYSMKPDVYQDNGAEIRSNIRTGFINHGTQNKKKSRKVQFRIKRGIAKDVSDTAGQANIKFRDDETGSFSNELKIDTGIGGDSRFNNEIYVGGIYRSRQWDITSSDNTPFIIGGFEEDLQILNN